MPEPRNRHAAIQSAIETGQTDRLLELSRSELNGEISFDLLVAAADGLIRLRAYDEALELLRDKRFPEGVRKRQLQGLALARKGELLEAQQFLGELVAEGHQDPETLGIYARTWMDRYKSSGEERHLRKSRDLYAQAFESHPEDYYTGINAASKSVFLGDTRAARRYAGRVEKLLGTAAATGDYWRTVTVAEVQLIQGRFEQAAELYRMAVDTTPEEIGSHESTWQQARALMEEMATPESDRKSVRRAFAHLEEAPDLLDAPLSLERLEIRNVRSIPNLTLPLAQNSTRDDGQWTLLLGDNGTGKSTLLRCLALALIDPELSRDVLRASSKQAPYVRTGVSKGVIDLLTSRGGRTLTLKSGRPFEKISSMEDYSGEGGAREYRRDALNRFGSAPVWGYGCRRAPDLRSSRSQPDFSPYGDVASLFDLEQSLSNPVVWLKDRQLAALRSSGGAAQDFYEALIDTLISLLPGDEKVEVDERGVWLEGPSIDRAPLEGLSDGYVATLGWVLDVVARWCEKVSATLEVPDSDFSHRMSGLVLVDELGLHLHPSWQMEIVRGLRGLFPKLSFVATTHSPLVLLGARPGEIVILQREMDGPGIRPVHRDLPDGVRPNEVLTGEWFGLSTTVDHETRRLLEEYRQLLRRGGSDEEIEAKKRQLRPRIGRVGDTSLEGLVEKVTAEILAEERREHGEWSAGDRDRVRERILKEARRRRKAS